VSEARVRVKAKDRAHAMHRAICAAEIRRRVLRFALDIDILGTYGGSAGSGGKLVKGD